MFKVVVGHSEDPDSLGAIEDVIGQCLEALSGETPQAGILFCAIEFDYTLILKTLRQQFPHLELIGCTSDGEVSSKLQFQEDSLTLTLFCSDQITIRAGISPNLSQDSDAAAQQAIANAQGLTDQTRLCLTVPDGLSANGVSVTKALAKALGPQVVLVGGTAADQWNFQKTYQFCSNSNGDQVLSDSLPILLFSGDLLISHGVSSGWQPISRMGVVTRSEGPIVYEIDHQPTTDFYQFYLKTLMDLNETRLTGEYPLAVFESEDSEDFYLRAPLSGKYALGQSISFMGDVPQGSRVQVTHATGDELIAATQLSIEQARQNYPGTQPAGLLIFSCAARRWLLGPRTREEYDLCQKILDPALPVCGFYTYGEIAPIQPKGETYYHQETFVTLMLGVE
jgi:hypothetical protein